MNKPNHEPDRIQQAILSVLDETLGPVLPDNRVSSAHLVDDLDMDSLDCIELVMGLEDEFHIEIDDSDADGWRTLGDVEAYLREKVKQ